MINKLGEKNTVIKSMGKCSQIIFLIFFCGQSAFVYAHDARPLSVTIVEQTTGLYRVVVRAPPSLGADKAPTLHWPASCSVKESSPMSSAFGSISIIVCENGLAQQAIELRYPDFNPSITSLFRLEGLGGQSITAVLPPSELIWLVPEEPDWQSLAVEYTGLGFKHIWLGVDHLLFVLGLLLLAQKLRKIFYSISGFTLAHSITLSLATLNVVRVPVSLVEAMIALSILFLAVEISKRNADSFSKKFPVSISFVFGLLHGFGFASVLSELSLPANELMVGLLFFNLGVEFGQLAFIVAAILPVMLWCRFWPSLRVARAHFFSDNVTDKKVLFGSYLLGIPAAYWCFERTALVFLS